MICGRRGIKLRPRIRNWKDLKWYRPSPDVVYQNIDELFAQEEVDWDLIACHLPDSCRSRSRSATTS